MTHQVFYADTPDCLAQWQRILVKLQGDDEETVLEEVANLAWQKARFFDEIPPFNNLYMRCLLLAIKERVQAIAPDIDVSFEINHRASSLSVNREDIVTKKQFFQVLEDYVTMLNCDTVC